ncbi:MAG: methyltransferase [Bacteroidales bacterium]
MNTYTAKTMQGLEPVLAQELEKLGATDIEILNRAVTFQGDQKVLYKANYMCRTALHILKPILEFDIIEQDDLYTAVNGLAWEKMFSVDACMTIDTQCFDSVFTHSRYASQIVKDGIVDRFRSLFCQRPDLDRNMYNIRVDLYMKNNHCVLSLDSSGLSLHRRGYRRQDAGAPLNEVLAAGLIALSGWDLKKPFYDPMCGSGTIAVEAAMLASGMPAAFYRKGFSFQYWNDYDPNTWKFVKEDALKELHDPECEIYASDIDAHTLSIAEDNLKKAKLHHDIHLFQADFFASEAPQENGHIVCNPPYGERLALDNAVEFYEKIGDTLKHKYTGYDAWFISSDIEALKRLGLKTNKRIELFNGPLECRYFGYQLY